MADETKSQPAKKIIKASDLEKIQPPEEVNFTYFSNYPGKEHEKSKKTGIYAGTFDVNAKKYFVITNARPSVANPESTLFVTSSIYTPNADDNLTELTMLHDFCKRPNLENKMADHLDSFRKIAEMYFHNPNNKQNKK